MKKIVRVLLIISLSVLMVLVLAACPKDDTQVVTISFETGVDNNEDDDTDENTVSIESIVREVGKAYGQLPVPKRKAHNFKGWFTSLEDGMQITSDTVVTETSNHTLYAVWVKVVIISFITNNEQEFGDTTREVGSVYGMLQSPTHSHFSFVGWFTAQIGGTQIMPATVVTNNSDHYVYARWQNISVEISFVTGTDEVIEGFSRNAGAKYGTLENPTRENYNFVGWFTLSTGGIEITEDSIVSNTANHNLYARWRIKEVTISFVTGTDEVIDDITREINSKYGSLPQPVRDYYNFVGWFTQQTGGVEIIEDSVISNTTNHNLYARWQVAGVEISFATYNSQIFNNIVRAIDSVYGVLPVPTQNNYDFLGWFTQFEGGTKITEESIVANTNHILHAQWKIKETVISFVTGTDETFESIIIEAGSVYGMLPTPSPRDYYDFAGWYSAFEGGTIVTAQTILTNFANHNLYARWQIIKVEISFVADTDQTFDTIIKDAGTIYGTLPTPLQRPSYNFVGWFTKSEGGAEILSDSIIVNTVNHSLYAVWEEVGLFIFSDVIPTRIIGITQLGRQQSALVIPENATSIGGGAFSGAIVLEYLTIPANITIIMPDAFTGVNSNLSVKWYYNPLLYSTEFNKFLKEVVVPADITSIGEGAFSGASKLETVIFEQDSMLLTIGNDAFNGTTNLIRLTIPASVTTVAWNAFNDVNPYLSITWYYNPALASSRFSQFIKEVIFPASVTSIGNSAFSGAVFTSITIPASVTSIGNSAFSGALNLETVIFEENSMLKSIGQGAFSGATNLTGIIIPASVTSIGEWVFNNTTRLVNITVNSANTNFSSEEGVLFNKAKTILIQYPIGSTRTSYAVPTSVTTIGDRAFGNAVNLETITFEGGLLDIGENAFSGATSLVSITIPASVISIGIRAFGGWTVNQTIYVKGKTQEQALTAWGSDWRTNANATFAWNA